jgi:hypothetical protein
MADPKPDPDPMEQASLPVFLVAQRQPDEVGRARCRVVHLSDAKRIRDNAVEAWGQVGDGLAGLAAVYGVETPDVVTSANAVAVVRDILIAATVAKDAEIQVAFDDSAAHAITHISEALGSEDDIAEMMAGEYAPVDEVRP